MKWGIRTERTDVGVPLPIDGHCHEPERAKYPSRKAKRIIRPCIWKAYTHSTLQPSSIDLVTSNGRKRKKNTLFFPEPSVFKHSLSFESSVNISKFTYWTKTSQANPKKESSALKRKWTKRVK